MNILGIDASLNCTGWFLYDDTDMKIIDYGYIPNKGLEEKDKILKIYNTLKVVIDNYKIDGVGIEEEFYGRNPATLKKLSHVHGAIITLLIQNNLSYTYYSVMTAKSRTLGHITNNHPDGTKKTGDEMKEEVAQKIFELFGRQNFIKPFTNDTTDAASIAYTYSLMGGQGIEKKKPSKKNKKTDKKTETKDKKKK